MVRKCDHEIIYEIGTMGKETGIEILLGNCLRCETTKEITKNYEPITDYTFRINTPSKDKKIWLYTYRQLYKKK